MTNTGNGSAYRSSTSKRPVASRSRAQSSSSPTVNASIRGARRAMWPRPKADATNRRRRVCLGGSESRIESACSQLNVSHCSGGVLSTKTRPSRRSRRTVSQPARVLTNITPSPR